MKRWADAGRAFAAPRCVNECRTTFRSSRLFASHLMCFSVWRKTLARSSGETVQICGRDGDKMVVEMMEEGPGHFQVSSRVGSRVPWNWTASGQLLVSTLPANQRAKLIAQVQDKPYQERQAGFRDAAGNCWWVATYTGSQKPR